MVVIEPEATEEINVKTTPPPPPPSSSTNATTATAKSTNETTVYAHRDASDGFETASDAELSDDDTQKPQQQVEEAVNEEELKQKALEEANEAKSEGNKLFGEGRYEEALSRYELALRVLPEDVPSSTELRAICHSNRGVCFLKLGKYEDTVKECSKALELNPTYMKALVRRGEAHEKLEKYEEAIADLQKIVELDPSNYQAKRTANRLKPLADEKREKMKEEMIEAPLAVNTRNLSAMTRIGEIQEIVILPEDPWALDLIRPDHDSDSGKRRRKKYRILKSPVLIPELILGLRSESSRERALRLLSSFLVEKREDDPEHYNSAACLLYNSCSTVTILLQEVVTFLRMMVDGGMNIRASKRLTNVLTLFQCIAANVETRQRFVQTFLPNFLALVIRFEAPLEVFKNLQIVALSVIGILCQAREPTIVQWAVENNMVEVCKYGIEIGSELSKVISMYILEAILQDDLGISHICSPMSDDMLQALIKTWDHQVNLLAVEEDSSPRLLFHIIRCYMLLCKHVRGHEIVQESLPDPIVNGCFHETAEEYPVIGSLIQQLLLIVGKTDSDSLPSPSLCDA